MAVYTEVSDEELTNFIAGYAIGEVCSFKGIAEGVENSNYLLNTNLGSFILTLYEKRVDSHDLPFFLGLMDHLAVRGVSCPTPVLNLKGQLMGQLCGRNAAIISFLDGMWVRKPSPHHCAGLGEAMANLHLAGADFQIDRPNTLSVQSWRNMLEASGARVDELKMGLRKALLEELDDLEENWPKLVSGLPSGIIHADLFPDNVFFKANKLSGLIDFYFACNDVFAYDVAICLNAWCFEEDGTFNTKKAQFLLGAYRNVRVFTESELIALPLLARGSAMRFLVTRLYDWLNTPKNAMVTLKDPMEFFRKLEFHKTVKSFDAYGVIF